MSQKTSIESVLNDNKHLLMIACNPATDEIIVSYQGVMAMTRFAKGMNVILNLLKKSRFEQAVDPFTAGLLQSLAADPAAAVQMVKAANGAIRGIGETGLHTVNRSTRRKLSAVAKKK